MYLLFPLFLFVAGGLTEPVAQVDELQRQLQSLLQPLLDFLQANPLVAILGVIVFLFLISKLPSPRRSRRTRTYGGRPISYHLGRALGDMLRGRSRRR